MDKRRKVHFSPINFPKWAPICLTLEPQKITPNPDLVSCSACKSQIVKAIRNGTWLKHSIDKSPIIFYREGETYIKERIGSESF